MNNVDIYILYVKGLCLTRFRVISLLNLRIDDKGNLYRSSSAPF